MWTEAENETLTKLRRDGFSCGEIANRMGKTRNAVIGRLHRLDPIEQIVKRPRKQPDSYKPEEIALLSWALSDRQIAEKIGRTTKSVQQKRQSLGIRKPARQRVPWHPSQPRYSIGSDTDRLQRVQEKAAAAAIAPEPPPVPRGYKPTLMQLGASMCKWPFGDPRHAEFHFCGADTGDIERPYCSGHSRQAYARFSPP